MDPLTLHTIRLIQHAKKLRSLIASVQQQQQETQKSVDFTRGKGKPPPVIDDVACRKLLRRSVAAICAHTGYDSCAESILETMTDIAHEFYLQFTRHLRTAADHAMQSGESGFPDIIQQVYHEMGIGSVTCLHDFYQYRVVNYHRIMEEQCQQLTAEYDKLKEKPIIKTQDTLSVIRIKEEPHSEINFPVLDDNDEVIEAEQLLNLEGLVGFEITVEHESATGLTTEVESKWSQSIKTEPVDKVNSLDSFDEPSSIQRDVPASQTPVTQSSEAEESMTDPGSIPVSDIMSPPSITSRPSKPKKKKKS
ncbi:hypothetical protein ACJMK2_031416 [Sinanodonta woodiana]|uniref:STAGA complex 65 subunit gamma n=1 Tax=Sinanodonta woodiana TaxID=1069815 RepID=A0ABD3X2Q0_SINWO